jgi:arsenate reductase
MRRIYHLSTCDTCRKILAGLNITGVELVNLRERNVSEEDLDFMFNRLGSYEALFNKRAQKWKALPDAARPKEDSEFRQLILEEYTFLKRPAAIVGHLVFIGNDAATVAALKNVLESA